MKKKFLAIALCLVILMTPLATVGAYADTSADAGYTVVDKTYTVTTADGLLAVTALINGGNNDYNITLAADIDLAGKTWTPIGTTNRPYKGVFNGANFTIKNLTCIIENTDEGVSSKGVYVSLIGKANEGCAVKNLKITGFNLQGVEFVSVIIGETAQANADDAESKVLVENVHVRETTVVGLNGDDNGKATSGGIRNSYTGAMIGKAGANKTEVNGCSVVATLTGDCRVAGLIGGESVSSSVKTASITVKNCVIAGNYAQTGAASGGVSAILGYHSTIPMTVTNCVSLAELVVKNASKGTKGAIAFDINKLTLTLDHCVVTGAPLGKLTNTTTGTVILSNLFIYKDGETAEKLSPLDKGFVASADVAETSKLTLNDTETLWSEAMLPVINKQSDMIAKAEEIFKNNTFITEAIFEEIVGHVHDYTIELAEAAFLKSAATCTEAAVYYKSCSCGGFDESITFTHGEPAGHKLSDKWTNNDTEHWHVCTVCLEEKSDVGTHTYGDWKVTREPTTKREGERAKACTVCGHEITEKLEKLVVTEAPAATNEGSSNGEDSGCGGSVLGFGAVALISLGACALCMKKKED
ncbi:MAG: hypothetical protein E7620_04455 [Ruminococcaceae bacterium]|nr:hypothetical protein [Oscillospiraceae bacterium]